MSKENEKVELKAVDEDSVGEESRFIRLHKDTVEEFDDQTVYKIGLKRKPDARLEAATKDELKIRSNDPDVGSLIEQELIPLEEEWESDNPSQKKVRWGWFVLLGLIFSAGITWSIVEVQFSEERLKSLEDQTIVTLKEEAMEDLGAELMVNTIEEAVRNFHKSSSIDELLKYVRHPERVRPLMEDYYSRNPLEPSKVEAIRSLDPLTIENLGSFWVMKTTLDSIGNSQVLVEVEGNDVAKVDWETFVCYQPMEWETFVDERPGGYVGDFRVYVNRDFFYTYEFADSSKFASYRLTALNSDQPLYGYVPRGGRLFRKIEELIDSSRDSKKPMILTLHIPKGALSKRGVLIVDMAAPRWVYLKSPKAVRQ